MTEHKQMTDPQLNNSMGYIKLYASRIPRTLAEEILKLEDDDQLRQASYMIISIINLHKNEKKNGRVGRRDLSGLVI